MQVTTKKERTVCLLKSWLDAVGIGHTPSKSAGFDLTVTAKDGHSIEVAVLEPEAQAPVHAGKGEPRGGWSEAEKRILEALTAAQGPLPLGSLVKAADVQIEAKVDNSSPVRNALRRLVARGCVARMNPGYARAHAQSWDDWSERERAILVLLDSGEQTTAQLIEGLGVLAASQTRNNGKARQVVGRLVERGWVEGVGCCSKEQGEAGTLLYALAGVAVRMDDLRSRDLYRALGAFHAVTERAGYGKPLPFERGEEPKNKLHYADNFELVSMRHRELRRSPNPDAATLKKYKPVIDKAAWTFLRWNNKLCARQGLEHDDLVQYAMIWTVNFLANYQVVDRGNSNNERMLYTHLLQRFGNFQEVLEKKARSISPDRDTFKVATQGSVEDYNRVSSGLGGPRSNRSLSWQDANKKPCDCAQLNTLETIENGGFDPGCTCTSDDDGVDVAYLDRNSELDLSSPDARRASASDLLGRLLGELPHEEMVERLRAVAEVDVRNIDPVARDEARRRLRVHAKDCKECGESVLPEQARQSVLEEDEEVAGVDASSVED